MVQGRLILLLVGVTVLCSCCSNVNGRLLDEAEENMETCADSALKRLLQVEGMSVLTEEQYARYALLLTQAMHKCRVPLDCDSLINVAVEYYRESDDRHRLAKALLYKGLVHKQNRQVELAAEAFTASEQAFEGVEDNQYKALLCNHYASLLLKQNLLDESLEYHKKAYLYELKGDSLHYVVSTCGQIATVYRLKKMADSAEVYYKRGLCLSQRIPEHRYVKLFMQNYAAFLTEHKQYDEAERILKESEKRADSSYIYNVYASLASLYYETGRYEQARMYSERMLESSDSLMQCSGFLHLYEIYKRQGDMETAVCYHNQYRYYHSDIVQRRKTAAVAVIPHKQKVLQLVQENRTAHQWTWLWAVAAVGAVALGFVVVRYLKREYGMQMGMKDALLEEKVEELEIKDALLVEKMDLLEGKIMQLAEVECKLAKVRANMGGLKGVMTRQAKTIEGLKEEQKSMKTTYVNVVKELKEEIKGLKGEQAKMERAVRSELKEYKRELELLHVQEKHLQNEVQALVAELDNSELLQRYMLEGGNQRSVLLVLELKYGIPYRKNPIHHGDYAELLKPLAEYARPGIRQLIETNEVLKDKQVLACLIALGYDDIETLRMATYLKTNTVRAYCTQVKAVIEASSSSPKGGEKNEERLSLTLPVREGTKLQNPPIVNSKN